MKKSFYLFITSCLFFSLTSCDSLRQEVNPDRLNREAAKLVVTCFLSPQDTVLAVKVTRSQPILTESTSTGSSNTAVNVPDATVTLSEGGRTATLRYDVRLGYYRAAISQLPVLAGRTYSIAVQTSAGERAEASRTVPEPVATVSVAFDSLIENQFGRQVKRYFIRSRWQDLANQANFYQVSGLFRYTPVCQNCPNTPANQPREQFNTLYFDDNSGGLLTDRNTDGGTMISDRAFFGIYYSSNVSVPNFNFVSQYKAATVTVNLFSTDQFYHQYQDAIARQSEVSGNPFAEPVPVPSNIQGTLGCFAGYNRSTLTVKLK